MPPQPPLEQFIQCPVVVERSVAGLFMAHFSKDYKLISSLLRGRGIESEEDVDSKHIVQVLLPKAVFIALRRVDESGFEFSFADHGPIEAGIIRQMFDMAVQTIQNTPKFVWRFTQCDDPFPSVIQELNRSLPSAVIDIPTNESLEKEFEDFDLIFCPLSPNVDPHQIEEAANSVFESTKLVKCHICHMFYNPKGDSANCVRYFHPGKRIPLDSGDMEEIEADEETGEMVTIVNYTCCGETALEDPGCKEEKMGSHKEESPLSTFEMTEHP